MYYQADSQNASINSNFGSSNSGGPSRPRVEEHSVAAAMFLMRSLICGWILKRTPSKRQRISLPMESGSSKLVGASSILGLEFDCPAFHAKV
ncbi:Hypothetical predicted protein [Olea europaea subsp. europaea]|uniref:Uncharacterized protein n=1 Tax=Olea europaea subsp. europaea TaxID=158383 RepID=A0A8S0UP45_OLEEU|nr:Hypothetical predicted protein [Olea europaea subsp. europaea]